MATAKSAKVPHPRDKFAAVVDVNLVRRAIEFASTYDVRYYLNGVCIKPSKSGGVLVMASDGHTALVLHDPEGKADKQYILPFNKNKHAKALSEKGAMNVAVCPKGGITVVGLHYETLFIHPGELIEGKYPDLCAAMGKLDDFELGIKGAFSPVYLQRALDSAGKREAKRGAVAFYGHKAKGDSSVSLFTTPGGFGLLMPMRVEPELNSKLTKDFGGTI